MGLGVMDHLNTMLELAVRHIVVGQTRGDVLRDPIFVGKRRQSRQRTTKAQIRIATARDQLSSLGEKLDLSNPTATQFDIVPLGLPMAAKPFVFPDPETHVMRILNGGKV